MSFARTSTLVAAIFLTVWCPSARAEEAAFDWAALPQIPPPQGAPAGAARTGAYMGAHEDAMIVAGGGQFPDFTSPPGEGLVRLWRDVNVLVRDEKGSPATGPDGKPAGSARYRWITASPLPVELAGGAAVPTPKGLLCIGGRDRDKARADVILLTWDSASGALKITELPPLPRPAAYCAAALIGKKVYVVAGGATLREPPKGNPLWSLDISTLDPNKPKDAPTWNQELPAYPGRPLWHPVAAAQNDGAKVLLYVTASRGLQAGPDGDRHEAWSMDPDKLGEGESAWRHRADPPAWTTARAAPVACGDAHIAFFGRTGNGDATCLVYHTITNTWTSLPAGETAEAMLTDRAARWGKDYVVLSDLAVTGGGGARAWRVAPRSAARGFGVWNWVTLSAYLAAMVGMGVYFSRREKSTDDFFLAGGRIPWWAAGLSIFGTSLSAITFMSIPEKVYRTNWVYWLNNAVPILLVPLVIYCYIPFYRRLKVKTAYEYLEERFNLPVRVLASAQFILFQLGRMAIVLYLPAVALATVTGMNVYLCIALMGLLCTVYTVLGGIEAVIWTDVLQVGILMGAAGLSLILIATSVDGGMAGVIRQGLADDKFRAFNLSWDVAVAGLWVIVVGNLFGNLLPLTADQTVVQRYLATRSEKAAAKALWLHALAGIPVILLFFGLGTALYVFYKTHPALLTPAVETNAIYPLFIMQQMPAGVSGLVIAGLFAAAMSSLDSSMNSIASSVVNDYYKRARPQADEGRCLLLARGLTIGLGLLGTASASLVVGMQLGSMWDVYLMIFGLLGGGLSALFMMGIFTRRIHAFGAIAGFLGSAGVLVWVKLTGAVHLLLYPAVGVVSCFVIGYLASLAIPWPRKNLGGLVVYRMLKKRD